LKRKYDAAVNTTSKVIRSNVDETAHSSNQIGHGHGDDDPCNLTSAFEENLKKIELKPRKDQKHDMSQFLRGKSKPILIHLSKELGMKKGLKWFISVKARFVKPKVDSEDLFSEPHFAISAVCVLQRLMFTIWRNNYKKLAVKLSIPWQYIRKKEAVGC
jgi:hypothetical protein